uniref:Uncharacterized protein n=1 Tax=Arundo donax TaxID=35708 RepID=A0A0A9C935_ARUDO
MCTEVDRKEGTNGSSTADSSRPGHMYRMKSALMAGSAHRIAMLLTNGARAGLHADGRWQKGVRQGYWAAD